MKSERNQGYEVQVRIGKVTMDSYLFFPRELGDLMLEPGDEVILVARHSKDNGDLNHGSWIGDSAFFERVKNIFASTRVMDRLTDVESNEWRTLREAINEAREKEVK